jgi:dTDP-4-dehydrorhamnose reductase
MILLLGASGYMGQAFARELARRGWPFKALPRTNLDGTRFEQLLRLLRDSKPAFLLNAAGYTGRPNVDACETARAETLLGNLVLPLTIAQACQAAGVPWGHVSSGCIYAGAKLTVAGVERVEKDLTQPDVRSLLTRNPGVLRGFTEEDEPNFTFRRPPCSFYSGSKALAEDAVVGAGQCYLWRLRIPFDEFDNSKNFLTKIQRYPKVYDNINSLSHRGDFVRACLDLWGRRAPFGTYNVTNPGFVSTRQVVAIIEKVLRPNRTFEFFASDEEFYRTAASTPRSNCVLDVSKLQRAGVSMRPVEEALDDALKRWTPNAS